MLRFSLLGSGSAGNAILVSCGDSSVLVDNGLSYRQLAKRAEAIGADLSTLKAVVVTHEHRDHVNGLGVLARKTGVPIYVTESTHAALPPLGKFPEVRFFEAGERFAIGDMKISSFPITHDAADPVSFTVESRGAKLGVATDLGSVTHVVRRNLEGSHALVLESNYCHEMIRNSSYPESVVQRIRSAHGHLSNADMNSLLKHLLHDDLQLVVAIHISQENNTEDKARAMADGVLRNHAAQLVLADQDKPTRMFDVARETSTRPLEDIA